MENEIFGFLERTQTRRALFHNTAKLAAGGALSMALLSMSPAFKFGVALAETSPFASDLDILNFALTLEQLEATLYNVLVGDPSTLGTGLTKTGSAGLIKNATYLKYVSLFRDHENQHVTALTAAISKAGGTPVAPKAKYNFPSVTDESGAMGALTLVEEVGVGAYQGAAGYIKNKGILTTAVSIHGVEAEHTGSLHQLLRLDPTGDGKAPKAVLTGAFTTPIAPADVLKIVGPILGA